MFEQIFFVYVENSFQCVLRNAKNIVHCEFKAGLSQNLQFKFTSNHPVPLSNFELDVRYFGARIHSNDRAVVGRLMRSVRSSQPAPAVAWYGLEFGANLACSLDSAPVVLKLRAFWVQAYRAHRKKCRYAMTVAFLCKSRLRKNGGMCVSCWTWTAFFFDMGFQEFNALAQQVVSSF